MATPTFVAAGTVGTAASGSGPPTPPGIYAGIAQDDLMIGVQAAGDNVQTAFPGGWTPFVEENNGALQHLLLTWKWAGSSESAPVVQHPGGSSVSAVIFGLRGVAKSDNPIVVLGAVTKNASSTTVTAAGITPLAATALVVWVGLATASGTSSANAYSTVGGTNPTFTERVESNNGLGTNEVDLAIDTGPSTTGAATGARTSTLSLLAMVNMAVMFTVNDVAVTTADSALRMGQSRKKLKGARPIYA